MADPMALSMLDPDNPMAVSELDRLIAINGKLLEELWLDPDSGEKPTFQNTLKRKQTAMNLDYDGTLLPIVEEPDRALMSKKMREDVRDVATYLPTAIVTGRCRDNNNDGTQKISRDALKVVNKPFVFDDPNLSIEDPFDQDNWKQTYYTLPHKSLNHGGTGGISVITCIGQSSKSMEIDPCNAQVSKRQHNEEVNWKDLNRSCESFARCFDELRFPIGGRFEAMRELIRIADEHDYNTIMKRSSVTFADKDMVVAGDLNRPLYVAAKINGFDIMAMMNNGSFLNLMPLSTFKAACIPKKSLVPETLSITGVTGKGNTLGHLMVDLQVGPIRSETCFYLMDTNLACHILLGRPWIHKFEGVASTYHQCFKGKFKGEEVVIKALQTPFES